MAEESRGPTCHLRGTGDLLLVTNSEDAAGVLTERDPVTGHVRHQSSVHLVAEHLPGLWVGVPVARPTVHLGLDQDGVRPGGVYEEGAGAGHGDVSLAPPALQRGLAVHTVTVPLLHLGGRGPHVPQHLPAGAGRGGRRGQGRLRGEHGVWRGPRRRPWSGVVGGGSLALISTNIHQVSTTHTSLTSLATQP